MRNVLCCLMMSCAAIALNAADAAPAPKPTKKPSVSFSSKPTATAQDKAVKISFALSSPSDVTVSILDAQKRIVRHLAAGMLGGAADPPEPLKKGLSQALLWDRTDDAGNKVSGGSFTAQVSIGTSVGFGRFLGGNPYALGTINSLAADDAGNLYLQSSSNGTGLFKQVAAFDKDGKYLRTLLPFPANLPPDRIKDWAWHDGTPHPYNKTGLGPEFYMDNVGLNLLPRADDKGIFLTDGNAIYRIAKDGGNLNGIFRVTSLWGNKALPNHGSGPIFLAPTADGKFIYLAGPFSAKNAYGSEYDPEFPPGQIYRLEVGNGAMKPFVKTDTNGVAWQGGYGWVNKHTKNADSFTVGHGPIHQIAVDPSGVVLVADRDNQCIAAYSPEGKALGKIDLPYPDLIAIDPATKHVYVMTKEIVGYHQYRKTLHKFSNWKEGKVLATLDLGNEGDDPRMTLVPSKPASLWIIGVKEGLLRVVDNGSALEKAGGLGSDPGVALGNADRIAVDREADLIYVSDAWKTFVRFDGLSGKGGDAVKFEDGRGASDLTVGPDGSVYAQLDTGDWNGPLRRYTRDLQPAPYTKTKSHELSKHVYGRMHHDGGFSEKGIGVSPDGHVFVIWQALGFSKYALTGFDSDGTAMKGDFLGKSVDIDPGLITSGYPDSTILISGFPQGCAGVRSDGHNNIYVGLGGLPKDAGIPPGFERDEAYPRLIGSVVKFCPNGGAIGVAGSPSVNIGVDCLGALKAYPGFGPMSGYHTKNGEYLGANYCSCRSGRFDLDGYGRLYLPNPITNSVRIIDNAGNLIVEFGSYGNFDSQGLGSSIPTPDIPLGWPVGVGASENHIYVSDMYNRRVVRADIAYAAQETCKVP